LIGNDPGVPGRIVRGIGAFRPLRDVTMALVGVARDDQLTSTRRARV